MILVFDLDDTLYDESTYALGGMAAVAAYLERDLRIPQQVIYGKLVERLAAGRGRVFDDVLTAFDRRPTKSAVEACVRVYRTHTPRLTLLPDAHRCLRRFAHVPLYLVTDGHKEVQASKVRALGLDSVMRRCFITHRYGHHRAKPSPWCFERICDLEKVPPHQVAYIGDNPNKDFVNLKPLGFRTVRLRRGMFAGVTLDGAHEAHVEIDSLDQLDEPSLARLEALPHG